MKRIVTFTAAIALAFGLAGCTESENRYGEAENTDAGITAEVERELIGEGLPGNIDVAANNGVVTLSGTVPDAEAKNRAEDIAEDIDGVDRVQNNLRTTMAGDAPQRAPQPGLDANEPAAGEDLEETGEDAGM